MYKYKREIGYVYVNMNAYHPSLRGTKQSLRNLVRFNVLLNNLRLLIAAEAATLS